MSTNEELEARILRLEIAHNGLVKAHNTLRDIILDIYSVGDGK